MADTQVPPAGHRRVSRSRPGARGVRKSDGTWTVEKLDGPYTWHVSVWTGTTWRSLGPKYPTERAALASREYQIGTTPLLSRHRRGLLVRFHSGLTVKVSWAELALPAGLLALTAAAARNHRWRRAP